MPLTPKLKVSLIGAGKVGSTLAVLLNDRGYKIVSIVSRDGKGALALAKVVRCQKVSTSLIDIVPETELIIIAVPDASVAQVAKQLASFKHLRFKKLLALHTSGVLTADVLKLLKKKGALIAALHPVQTFPVKRSLTQLKNSTKGIFYGIDGDSKAIVKVEQLISDINGKPVVIPPELKPLYHLACVFASGYLMVLLNVISEIASQLNLKAAWTEVFGPLMTSSMQNTIRHGINNALTGPIVRKDFQTITTHLESLGKYAPRFLPLYMAGGIESARIARKNGKLSDDDYSDLIDTFKNFIRSTPINSLIKVKR